jgi:hypothetical protein
MVSPFGKVSLRARQIPINLAGTASVADGGLLTIEMAVVWPLAN